MEIDIISDVLGKRGVGIGVVEMNPGKKKFARSAEDIMREAKDFGEIGPEVERNGSSADQLQVKSEIIQKDDIGEPTRVIQIWQSGEMFGITIGSKFYHVDAEIHGLFINAVRLNRSLKTEIEELQRQVKILRYAQ